MITPAQHWRNFAEHLRFKYAPRIVNWLLDKSKLRAKAWLRVNGAIRILVDNTVLYHAITQETGWISTGKSQWGLHEIDTGYAARIPVHPADVESREYQNVCFLPGLAHLAKAGLITIYTSAELKDEQFRQTSGRYRGYGYFDHSLFGDLRFESIDGHVFPTMGPSTSTCPRRRTSNAPASFSIASIKGSMHWLGAWD